MRSKLYVVLNQTHLALFSIVFPNFSFFCGSVLVLSGLDPERMDCNMTENVLVHGVYRENEIAYK